MIRIDTLELFLVKVHVSNRRFVHLVEKRLLVADVTLGAKFTVGVL